MFGRRKHEFYHRLSDGRRISTVVPVRAFGDKRSALLDWHFTGQVTPAAALGRVWRDELCVQLMGGEEGFHRQSLILVIQIRYPDAHAQSRHVQNGPCLLEGTEF